MTGSATRGLTVVAARESGENALVKVTLLGHASVLVEVDGAVCLMDPVFGDPFEEGAVMSCPRREVHVDLLPKLDLIILSHNHLDHFDIPTLARLPRDCDVVCPQDETMVYALKALGFEKVHPTAPMTQTKIDGYEVLTTHSSVSNVIEIGVVFKDESGTFWNQVDTVLMPKTIETTKSVCGDIDLLFAMYASQLFGFFDGKGLGFPTNTHQMNLANIRAIAPRLVVPGSAGFRFAEPFAWCNSFLFPVSRERFLADLSAVAPGVPSTVADPGDVFEIGGGRVVRHAAASSYATMIEDDSRLLDYDATAEVPPLTDPNPDGYSEQAIDHEVEGCLRGFSRFVEDAYATPDPIYEEYRALSATYALIVVFPDGHERWIRIVCGRALPSIESGSGAAPASAAAHRIAASALTAWCRNEKSYFYYRGFSRRTSTLCAVSLVDEGVVVEPKTPTDLLTHYLTRKAPGAALGMKTLLDFKLKQVIGRPRPANGRGRAV